jgi:hypothetical protein
LDGLFIEHRINCGRWISHPRNQWYNRTRGIMHAGFYTIIAVLIIAGGLVFRINYVHQKRIGYFQLFQVAYLVIIPGIIYPLVFSYLNWIAKQPMNDQRVFSDGFLTNMVLISILFSYGGLVIHAVTKQLWRELKDNERSPAYILNSKFHLTISHNLLYSGVVLTSVGVTLLELNHVPVTDPTSVTSAIIKGLLMGGAYMFMVFNYRPYTTGRWSDLKTFFLVMWLCFVGLLYGIAKVDPRLTEYQLLLPTLISVSVMTLLSVVVVARKVKRGWQLRLSRKRLAKMVNFGEEEWS